jgi:hypothetical protein
MQVIPTRIHGLLDYTVGILLVASPWLFNFSDGGAQTWIPVVLGLGVLGYSLATRYEFGLVKLIPMPIHLILDTGGGLFLAISPWLFGFSDQVWIPFVVIGVFEIAAAALTQWEPSRDP